MLLSDWVQCSWKGPVTRALLRLEMFFSRTSQVLGCRGSLREQAARTKRRGSTSLHSAALTCACPKHRRAVATDKVRLSEAGQQVTGQHLAT